MLAFSLLVMFDSESCFRYFVHVKGIHLLKWTVLPLQSWASFCGHINVFSAEFTTKFKSAQRNFANIDRKSFLQDKVIT